MGGEASCNACRWKGRKDDLLAVPMFHDMGSGQEVLISMFNSWRKLYGKLSQDIVQFLLEWGFITAKQEGGKLQLDRKEVGRFISAATVMSLTAILEERQKREKERGRRDGN